MTKEKRVVWLDLDDRVYHSLIFDRYMVYALERFTFALCGASFCLGNSLQIAQWYYNDFEIQ